MLSPENPYSLLLRPTGYYVKFFWNKKWKSLGTKNEKEAHRRAAIEVAKHPHMVPSPVTLNDFAKGFFDWKTSEWIRNRLENNHTYSEKMARDRTTYLDKYILKRFGSYAINMIPPLEVRTWLREVVSVGGKYRKGGQKLSNSWKRQLLATFKIVMREAMLQEIITKNPIELVELPAPNYRKTGIYTRRELAKMFPENEDDLLSLWGSPMWATFFFFAFTTGSRFGELRALQWRDVNLKVNAILVDKAFKAGGKDVGSTKTGTKGIKFLTARAHDLFSIYQMSTHRKLGTTLSDIPGETIKFDNHRQEMKFLGVNSPDLLFTTNKGRPVDPKNALTLLREVLADIGISEKEIKERKLDIHSFRHTFDTFAMPHVPREILKMLMLHSVGDMSEWYNHPSPALLLAALEPFRPNVEKALSLDEERFESSYFFAEK